MMGGRAGSRHARTVSCQVSHRMSAMGQKWTWRRRIVMSALPPKADVDRQPIRRPPSAKSGLMQQRLGGCKGGAVYPRSVGLGHRVCARCWARAVGAHHRVALGYLGSLLDEGARHVPAFAGRAARGATPGRDYPQPSSIAVDRKLLSLARPHLLQFDHC